jgi:hypothetical protein
VHEEGFQLERQADGELQFYRPNGQLVPEVPPPPHVPADPTKDLRARNEAAGLALHARTAIPSWQGERLDVGWAIDGARPTPLC